jgi:ubiquinone biosynthesis protein UbiJ
VTPRPPKVSLGRVAANGISPSIFGLVDRGARLRPALARELRGTVEIRFRERFAAVRIAFEEAGITVEDAKRAGGHADLVIEGSLPDVVQLSSAPLAGGLPKLTHRRGRAALMRIANRSVTLEGDRKLARRLLRLMEL